MRDLPAVSLTWRDGLFVHWPVETSRVRPLVPDELDVDTREGTAWVSALPSLVTAIRPWFLPDRVGLTFPQVNLRTYVRHESRPGVYFLSLDATSALGVGVARALWGLPYHRADVDFQRPAGAADGSEGSDESGRFRFDCQRVRDASAESPVRFTAEYRPTGRPTHADPDSLSAFLAERHRLYLVRDAGGENGENGGSGGNFGGSGNDGDARTVWCTHVEHDPWGLCPAEATVHADDLLASVGLPAPDADSVVRYAPSASFTVRTPFRARVGED